MAKKAKASEVTSEVTLENGSVIKGFDDGSFKFYPAPIELSAEDVSKIFGSQEDEAEESDEVSIEDMKAALLESEEYTKKDLKKMSDEEIQEAYEELETGEDEDEDEEEDEEEDEVSIEDMKAALVEAEAFTKKELKKMSDEEIQEAYDELETEGEDEDDADNDEDEDLTGEDLAEKDFSELEDICDEKELTVDPDDFSEKDVEKLRKAIAKELGLTLPKSKK